MKTAIWTDPIVAETRRWREELLEEAQFDLRRLTQRLIQDQARYGDRVLDLQIDNIDDLDLASGDET